MPRFEISVANEQASHAVDEQQLVAAIEAVLQNSHFSSASISLAIVDDTAMHQLNRQYLHHDYPTDVLSFVLSDTDQHLEGEIIISTETAHTNAAELGCTDAAEQLLYVIHGTLHLVGYRDKSPKEIKEMRAAEALHLRHFGFDPTLADSEGANAR